ncbi:hypothetical protein NDU88_006290 [Pleurodeles waltl]|uniref:Uncharacterized protein n=1 Tax=Pleurodeles waltl TaxID=8319 RepID=A0AAV7TY27_PLEWA|nr:hypothetical protein NDU88_006290 [Pleurodeles waltl]
MHLTSLGYLREQRVDLSTYAGVHRASPIAMMTPRDTRTRYTSSHHDPCPPQQKRRNTRARVVRRSCHA